MHPNLWTVPGIDFPIRSWGFFVVIGALAAIGVALRRSRRYRLDPGFVMTLCVIGVVAGVIGCRGMYLLHYEWDAVRTGQVGFRHMLAMSRGGEILGGVLLSAVSVITYLFVRRKPILPHLDLLLPVTLLGMGIGRFGCLMAGCCWGGICETPDGAKALPWAIRFDYGSPALGRDIELHRVDFPPELMWRVPGVPVPIPITPGALDNARPDNSARLQEVVTLGEEYARAQSINPDGSDAQRLKQKLQEAGRGLRTIDVLAARHLRNLATNGTPRSWADLRARAATMHSRWVHPSQVYDAVALLLLFGLLSVIYRRGRTGEVVAWTMVLYPINRVLQEAIRGDNPHDTFGLTISTFISLVVLVAGLGMLIWLAIRKPVRTDPGEMTGTMNAEG
jgi:phosphatidylglycerol:prolipoprotein diacylglycerol transferase